MRPEEHKLEDFIGPFNLQFLAMRKWCKATRSPFSLTLEMTPLCNFNCPMCYVHLSRAEMEQRGKPLSAAQWLATNPISANCRVISSPCAALKGLPRFSISARLRCT